MTKRNIAIANFSPQVVEGSSWPRFTGWKMVGKPVIESGLFGLIDKDVRMHRFFKDTTIGEIISEQLRYIYNTRVIAPPEAVIYHNDGTAELVMPKPKAQDHSIRWLPPYQFTDSSGVEWDVYVLITGADIHIKGDFFNIFKAEGYWDMGVWMPRFQIGEEWNDIKKIEQHTINYVVSSGYPAMVRKGSFLDKENAYVEHNVSQLVPE